MRTLLDVWDELPGGSVIVGPDGGRRYLVLKNRREMHIWHCVVNPEGVVHHFSWIPKGVVVCRPKGGKPFRAHNETGARQEELAKMRERWSREE